LQMLHDKLASEISAGPVSVHLAVEPCMTGISRFGMLHHANLTCVALCCSIPPSRRNSQPSAPTSYSKAESWAMRGPETFDYLFTDSTGPVQHQATHEQWLAVPGFSRLALSRRLPFVAVETKEQLFVLRRRRA
jgi:hypothetical protein